MTNQIKRSIAFLAGNFATTAVYILILLNALGGNPSWDPWTPVRWSRIVLIYIGVQIVFRIIAMIALAIVNAISRETEQVDREDELDKAIDLKSTSLTSGIFMVFFLAALATQALGLPQYWLFAVLSVGLVVSGLCGDLANLFYYHRGY